MNKPLPSTVEILRAIVKSANANESRNGYAEVLESLIDTAERVLADVDKQARAV